MEPTQRLQIANRIRIDLMREIGQGVDLRQMLDSELYARDVLLVCEAFAGHELQRLGQAFARSMRQPDAHGTVPTNALLPGAPAAVASAEPATPHAVDATPPEAPDSRWLHPSRWFAA